MSIDDDIWAENWLHQNYTGAPDECSTCFRQGRIIKSKDCQDHKA